MEPRLLAVETAVKAVDDSVKSVISPVEALEQRPAITMVGSSSSGGSSGIPSPFVASFVLVQFKPYNSQAVAPSEDDAKKATKEALASLGDEGKALDQECVEWMLLGEGGGCHTAKIVYPAWTASFTVSLHKIADQHPRQAQGGEVKMQGDPNEAAIFNRHSMRRKMQWHLQLVEQARKSEWTAAVWDSSIRRRRTRATI